MDALIGLAIGDQQVRRLLGVLPMPEPEKIEARADRAVGEFLTLFARRRSPAQPAAGGRGKMTVPILRFGPGRGDVSALKYNRLRGQEEP